MHDNFYVFQQNGLGTLDIMFEVLEGLNQKQKRLPSKLFYDQRGSELFDRICNLDEYYLTQTEIGILIRNIEEIASLIGERCLLIELGSGSGKKTRLILDHLKNPTAYIPIDISFEQLIESSRSLAMDYPNLNIFPVCADYTLPFNLPTVSYTHLKKVVFFPGSTIGNFTPDCANNFMRRISERLGKGSGLLIGVDLRKDKDTLEIAYNDNKGVTAEFNLNMLERVNRELKSDFDLNRWRHYAFYNDRESRIEMHLISQERQIVHVNGTQFSFKKNETILTEYSYKYTLEKFRELVKDYFEIERVWTDEEHKFSVQYLSVR